MHVSTSMGGHFSTYLIKELTESLKGRFISDLAIGWKHDFADTIAQVC